MSETIDRLCGWQRSSSCSLTIVPLFGSVCASRPLLLSALKHRDRRIERAARRMPGRALQVLGRLRHRKFRHDLMTGLGRNQAEERHLVIGIGDDDDPAVRVEGHGVGAPLAASGDRRGDGVGLEIDDLDGAVAVTHPQFGAALHDGKAVGARRIAAARHADEAGDAGDVSVGFGVEDDDRLVVLVGEIAEAGRLIDRQHAVIVDRLTGDLNGRDLLEGLGVGRCSDRRCTAAAMKSERATSTSTASMRRRCAVAPPIRAWPARGRPCERPDDAIAANPAARP